MARRTPPRNAKGRFVSRRRAKGRRTRRNPSWVPANYGDDSRKRKRRRKSRGKARRTPPRGRGGRFLSRKRAAPKRRRKSRRRVPSRSVKRLRRGKVAAYLRKATRRLPRSKVRLAARRRARGRYTNYTGGKWTPFGMRRRRPLKKHLRATRAIAAGSLVRGLVVRNPRTGEIMPYATVANPRRRRRSRRHHASNPRRRRRVGGRRRRTTRNPGRMGGIVSTFKRQVPTMVGGFTGGAVAGIVDAKLLAGRSTIVSMLGRVGLAVGGALALRKRPALASGFVGGVIGSLGYSAGVKLLGGLVATSKGKALQGLADMADEDPELAAVLGDLGALTEGDIESNYGMGAFVDDGMGAFVEDE